MSGSSTQPFLFKWQLAFVQDERLTAADRHIALTIALHMDLDGRNAFPSITTLAGETARKRHTVIRSIKTLERCGWLEVKRGGIGVNKDVNKYRAKCPKRHLRRSDLSAPRGDLQVPQGTHELPRSSAGGADFGSRPAAGTCTHCHTGGGLHTADCPTPKENDQ